MPICAIPGLTPMRGYFQALALHGTMREGFHELNFVDFLSRWQTVIKRTDYFLSDDELTMIGIAYNRSIVLIQQAEDGTARVNEICSGNVLGKSKDNIAASKDCDILMIHTQGIATGLLHF